MLNKFTKQELVLYSVILFFTAIAWFSFVDKAAYNMNIESLKDTTAAFALIKLIDAGISVAQNVPILGSLLSPYNDFIDRISWVMLLSLLSLGLQKVIIVALQSFLVNAIISINVGVIVLNKFVPFLSDEWLKKLLKLAVLLLFIRFAIPLMTISIMSIESDANKAQSEARQERIEKLQNELLDIRKLTEESENAKLENERQITLMEAQIAKLEQEQDERKEKIGDIKSEKGIAILHSLDQDQETRITREETRIDAIDGEIEALEQKIEERESSVLDIFENTKTKIKTAMIRLNALMENLFDEVLTWTVLFLFKCVVFPLLFLWGLAKLADGAFRTSLSSALNSKADEKILK